MKKKRKSIFMTEKNKKSKYWTIAYFIGEVNNSPIKIGYAIEHKNSNEWWYEQVDAVKLLRSCPDCSYKVDELIKSAIYLSNKVAKWQGRKEKEMEKEIAV